MKTTRRIRILMGRLQTGTENKLAPLANRLATMPQKRLHKGILVRLSRFITSKGRLDGCHADLLEIRLQETPLLVRRAIVEPVDHRLGEIAGVRPTPPVSGSSPSMNHAWYPSGVRDGSSSISRTLTRWSCTATTSASRPSSHSKKPLLIACRNPLTLTVTTRIDVPEKRFRVSYPW